MLIEIDRLLAPQWKARVGSIYAGRTFSNDDTAASNQNPKSGMVAISHEFATILIAYSSMYGLFLRSVDDAKRRSLKDARAIQIGMRRHFDEIIDLFKEVGYLALSGSVLLVTPDKQSWRSVEALCEAAEKWTLAHEIAHHVARDMSNRIDKGVERILSGIKAKSSMREEINGLSKKQRHEVEADLLASLILSGYFAEQGRPAIAVHGVIPGAAVALIAVAHHRDEWTNEPGDDHPGCSTRLRILFVMMCELFGDEVAYPDDPSRADITLSRSAARLMAFARWAENAEKAEEFADELRELFGAPEASSPVLVTAHYAVEFGTAARDYAERHGAAT
ncbi:hypothetical protein [Lentzea sp. HUAS12]|uniref:hypothetical protein n=1 Tax=Lentzea sp. HUAS12 TaxID=2951806 RepID=UPI00209FB226|nr:hypothetical protein [Lentzea sp. HUAS12]USX54099.1 hypothetical protein ND450_08360 [Lentzea sp. HUAS12]